MQLLDVCKELDENSRKHGTMNILQGDHIAFENVRIQTPTGNVFVAEPVHATVLECSSYLAINIIMVVGLR